MDVLKKQGECMWHNQTPENIGSDIYHINAIKYNPNLDQVVFSSPHLSEIFIIDHSTTTKEAAGHEGGRWGKGGDFLYRWGNPQNYDMAILPINSCLVSMMYGGLKKAIREKDI